jgi:hypothetical protein
MTLAFPFSILTAFTTFQLPFGNFWKAAHGALSARVDTEIEINATPAIITAVDRFLIIRSPRLLYVLYILRGLKIDV